MSGEVALELGDGGEMAEDDRIHASRINEIREGSKGEVQRIHRFRRHPLSVELAGIGIDAA